MNQCVIEHIKKFALLHNFVVDIESLESRDAHWISRKGNLNHLTCQVRLCGNIVMLFSNDIQKFSIADPNSIKKIESFPLGRDKSIVLS